MHATIKLVTRHRHALYATAASAIQKKNMRDMVENNTAQGEAEYHIPLETMPEY